MRDEFESFEILNSSVELPCGAILKNRIAKSAMSDSLGNGEGDPTETQMRLYEKWAEGGVAVSFIGEMLSSAINTYEERDELRCTKWRKKFSDYYE